MKYIKMLGLAAMALTALMAFAGAASATSVTSTTGQTPTITASSEGSTTLTSNFFITVHCSESHVHGTVTSHGVGKPVSGPISSLTFGGCINGTPTVINPGSLSVTSTATTGNGTVSSSGAEVLVHTSVGECLFGTKETHLGTLTGGEHATLDIKSASIPVVGGSFFCPTSAVWEGSYKVTHPTDLTVH